MRGFHEKKLEREPLFKIHPWHVIEEEFTIEDNHRNEAIFSLGNGYLGLRGNLEEDYSGPRSTTSPGFYINGVYDSEEIIYGEEAPNLPKYSQTIVNLMDWTGINLYIREEKLDLLTGKVEEYKRILDMRNGLLKRNFIWESPKGDRIKVEISRLISLTNKYLALIDYRIRPLNFKDNIRLVSTVEGRTHNFHHFRQERNLEVINAGFANNRSYLTQQTSQSRIAIAGAFKHDLKLPADTQWSEDKFIIDDKIIEEFSFYVRPEEEYSLTKFAAFHDSVETRRDRILNRAMTDVNQGFNQGVKELKINQKKYMEDFWQDFDVFVRGDGSIQQALRFNAFQLLQSTGKDGKTSVAAKGLTGEFYEGHYFWDTETYIVPFYLFNRPEVARKLLEYRYNILEEARKNATRVKVEGALFPWRTINGKEASGFFMGSTVQFHIDADIAYAIYLYVTATEDFDFLYDKGAEILVETARMWASRGDYVKECGGEFYLNEVCGPDEYKPGVDNNCYTNYLAKFNLLFARDTIVRMEEEAPDKFNQLVEKIDLSQSEVEEWLAAAENMYLPYDEELKIHPQDDSFLCKEPIDIEEEIPDSELPLVKNWHPLTIWRYQLIKQADVILLMLILGDQFSLEDKKRNYDFYEPKTTHDSSLSPSVYSIIASEIGYQEEAYKYFIQTARIDLDDFNENTYQGLHTAGMGSAWMTLVYGFAGMRNYKGSLSFKPYLPEKLDSYQFTIYFKGRHIRVKVTEEGTGYRILTGKTLEIEHCGEVVELKPSSEKILPLRDFSKLPWKD